MIPKVIHYCWFGRNPLPKSALKCINSWRSFFPDYEIKEWNEKGVKFLGYINPFMAIEKELYAYASEHGYCVKDKEGKDYYLTVKNNTDSSRVTRWRIWLSIVAK